MKDELVIESKGPVKFDPYCVCCGSGTKKRVYHNMPPLILLFILGPGTLFLIHAILKMDSGRPWIPCCFKCQWNAFLPSRKSILFILLAILFLGIGICFQINEWFLAGLIFFACVFISLIAASVFSRKRRNELVPFTIRVSQDKIIYTFTSGHFYDTQMQQLKEKEKTAGNCDK